MIVVIPPDVMVVFDREKNGDRRSDGSVELDVNREECVIVTCEDDSSSSTSSMPHSAATSSGSLVVMIVFEPIVPAT